MQGIIKSNKAKKRGFTLIETALSLVVLSVLSVVAIQVYNLYYQNKIEARTIDVTEQAEIKVSEFLALHGRYPCPARADTSREDMDYGMETDCSTSVVAGVTIDPGQCKQGICVQQTTDIRTDALDALNPPIGALRVRRGMLPFRSLGVPESSAMDGYGTRLNYAVTERLALLDEDGDAVDDGYQRTMGGISIVDSAGDDLLDPPGTGHFVIFSSGSDRAGGYSRNGVQAFSCNTATETADSINCEERETAVYVAASLNKRMGEDYYDDILKYASSAETPLFKMASNAMDFKNLGNDKIVVGAGGVAAGFEDAANLVDVKGDIQVDGRLQTGRISSETGTDGFKPEQLETGENLDCETTGNYIIGFKNGEAECGMAQQGCAPNQVIKGFESDGSIICKDLVGCQATEIEMCPLISGGYEIKTLPAAPTNPTSYTYLQTSQANKYMHKAYSCKMSGSKPEWVLNESKSNCTSQGTCCTECIEEVTLLENVNCNNVSDTVRPNDGNFSGTIDITQTRTCPDGALVESVTTGSWADSCTCVPRVYDWTNSCPSGQTGQILRHNEWICDGTGSGHWANASTTNQCSCSPGTQSAQEPCPIWMSNSSWTRTRERYCPSGYSPWTTMPAGACGVCIDKTQNFTDPCPNGQSGQIYKKRTYNCAAGQWGPDQVVSNNCAVSIPKWKAGSLDGKYSSPLSYEVGDNCVNVGETSPCSAPSTGGQHTHYSSCRCE